MSNNYRSYKCFRCGKTFNRLDKFKLHFKRPSPSNRCKDVFGGKISWSNIQKDAEKQIDYYKKHKKNMYNTDEDIKNKISHYKKKQVNIHHVLRYNINFKKYKSLVKRWLDKKESAGYEILRVISKRSEHHEIEYIYLVKNNKIYTPYKKNKNLIQVGEITPTTYLNKHIKVEEQSPDYYLQYPQTTYKQHQKSRLENFMKIDPNLIVYSEKDEVDIKNDIKRDCEFKTDDNDEIIIDSNNRPTIINGYYYDHHISCESPMLTYTIRRDDSNLMNSSTDKKGHCRVHGYYGETQTYYNTTYHANQRRFIKHEKPINKPLFNKYRIHEDDVQFEYHRMEREIFGNDLNTPLPVMTRTDYNYLEHIEEQRLLDEKKLKKHNIRADNYRKNMN